MSQHGGLSRALFPPVQPHFGHRANRLLASLSHDTAARLVQQSRLVSLAQGKKLFEPGDPIDTVYFPETGMISAMIVTGEGDLQHVLPIGREGALGVQRGFGQRRSFTRAIVQVEGRFSIVAGGVFEDLVRGTPELYELIVRYMETLWAEALQTGACNAVHSALHRLCRLLLQCADKVGGDRLPLTQEFLAHLVGVRRTTVTLLAQSLQNEGAIRYSRGHITILDRRILEAHACECYEIIREGALPPRLGLTA